MADRWVVEEWFSAGGMTACCAVIIDGHRGGGAADYARELLPRRIRAGLLSADLQSGDDGVAGVLVREMEECDAQWATAQKSRVPAARVR